MSSWSSVTQTVPAVSPAAPNILKAAVPKYRFLLTRSNPDLPPPTPGQPSLANLPTPAKSTVPTPAKAIGKVSTASPPRPRPVPRVSTPSKCATLARCSRQRKPPTTFDYDRRFLSKRVRFRDDYDDEEVVEYGNRSSFDDSKDDDADMMDDSEDSDDRDAIVSDSESSEDRDFSPGASSISNGLDRSGSSMSGSGEEEDEEDEEDEEEEVEEEVEKRERGVQQRGAKSSTLLVLDHSSDEDRCDSVPPSPSQPLMASEDEGGLFDDIDDQLPAANPATILSPPIDEKKKKKQVPEEDAGEMDNATDVMDIDVSQYRPPSNERATGGVHRGTRLAAILRKAQRSGKYYRDGDEPRDISLPLRESEMESLHTDFLEWHIDGQLGIVPSEVNMSNAAILLGRIRASAHFNDVADILNGTAGKNAGK